MSEGGKGYGFYNLNELESWVQYLLAAKSLLKAIRVDNPEETVLVQLTISELSVLSFALLPFIRLFPEFVNVATDLSLKVQAVSIEQGFLKDLGNDTLDSGE